jgi:hypothetical protein
MFTVRAASKQSPPERSVPGSSPPLEMPETHFSLRGSITLERREAILLKPFAILRWQILKEALIKLIISGICFSPRSAAIA